MHPGTTRFAVFTRRATIILKSKAIKQFMNLLGIDRDIHPESVSDALPFLWIVHCYFEQPSLYFRVSMYSVERMSAVISS